MNQKFIPILILTILIISDLKSQILAEVIPVNLSEKERSDSLQLAGLLEVVRTFNEKGLPDAKDYCRQLIERAIQADVPIYEGFAYHEMGLYFGERFKLDSAIHYFKKALRIYEEEDVGVRKNLLLSDIGNIYVGLEEFENAEAQFELVLSDSASYEDPFILSAIYSNLGNFSFVKSKYVEELEYFLKVFELGKQAGNVKTIIKATRNIGFITSLTGDYDGALEYLQRARQLAAENDLYTELTSVNQHIGLIYDYKGQYEIALAYFEDALGANFQLQDTFSVALNYHNLAVAYENIEEYEIAEDYYFQSINIKKQFKDRRSLGSSYVQLGALYLKMERYRDAKEILDISYQLAEELRSLYLKSFCYKYYSEYYFKIRDYQSALEYQYKYILTIQQIFNTAHSNAIQELEKQHETKQKVDSIIQQKAAIILLEKEKEIAREELKFRNTIIVGVLMIAALFGWFLYSINKKNKQLGQKNELIENLFVEVQHRVKNNLQFLSSLFALHALSVNNETAKKVISEGRERIKAMGLLHDKLLLQDKLEPVINVREYLVDLVEILKASLKMEQVPTINLNIQNFDLEIERAMSIGLIVNELINNSIKHVQHNYEDLKIDVSLKKGKKIQLVVEDNGNGFPDKMDHKTTPTFGMGLVDMLCQQLKGKIVKSNNPGARFELKFSV